PLRSRLVANFTKSMRLAAIAPWLYNWAVSAPDVSRWIKKFSGFAAQRSLPGLHPTTLAAWHARHANKNGKQGGARPPGALSGLTNQQTTSAFPNGRVHLFCDEFTNY